MKSEYFYARNTGEKRYKYDYEKRRLKLYGKLSGLGNNDDKQEHRGEVHAINKKTDKEAGRGQVDGEKLAKHLKKMVE